MSFPIALCILLTTLNTVLTQSPCSWPDEFTDTIWHDSDRGEITFSNTSLTGWDLAAVGDVTVADWDCYTVNITGPSSLTITFKAQQTFSLFSTFYQAFACLTLETFSTNAYYYYLMSGEELRLNYDRIKVIETTILESFTPTEADICLDTTSTDVPTANEYHLLIRNDRTETAIRDCPEDYFGIHEYTVNDGSSDYCTISPSSWDACTVQNTMQFNYSLCSTVLANSAQGIVSCLFDMVNVNYHLVTVLTKEISSTQRFSCFMSYNAGNGTLFVSEFPGSCRRSQTPYEIPVSGDGSTSGLKMILTEADDCIPTTTTTSTTTSTTTTTPTTTTTTPTTTTTTPTTTTTTPTTTTTTPTTTTTTPTTTTTTPTTTTTTPTTTTTTPTTTTTTPTTTTTTPTTTTTTLTTTTTTEAPVTTQAQSSEDNTVLIFAVAACSLAVLLIIILLVIVIMRYCCRKKPVVSPPKTPDINIEAMTHKQAGYGILPWGMTKAPAITTYSEQAPGETDDKSVSNIINDADYKSTLLAKKTTAKTEYDTPTAKTVKVVDGIIIDETVNFAMRYSSRMMIFKKEWEERKGYDKSAVSEKTIYIPTNNGTHTASISTSEKTFNGRRSLTPVNVLDFSECRSLNENDVSLLSDQTLPVSVAEST